MVILGRESRRRSAQLARRVGYMLNRPFSENEQFARKYRRTITENHRFLRDGPLSIRSIVAPYRENAGKLTSLMKPVVDSGRSITFTTCHCGNFFLSLLLCGLLVPPEKRCTIVRTHRVEFDADLWRSALRKEFGLKVDFLDTTDERLGHRLVKRIRNREVLAILADLHYGYGRTAEGVLFGRKAWFASGWIDLAYGAKSIVVVFSPITKKRRWVEITKIIDPLRYDNRIGFRTACVNSITTMLEGIVQVEPWCWMMFESVDGFFWDPSVARD